MTRSPILSVPVEVVALIEFCWFGDTLLIERLALMRAAIKEAEVLVFMETLWRVQAAAELHDLNVEPCRGDWTILQLDHWADNRCFELPYYFCLPWIGE